MTFMTDGEAAVKLAVELLLMPSRLRFARKQALPPELSLLLHIAAGDEEAAASAARGLKRSHEIIIEASRFFIEQILLAPDADSYRVLGASRHAPTRELRRNMALLLRSLHPDVEHELRSVFAQRVTGAWENLKTSERRAAYDRQLDRHERGPEIEGSHQWSARPRGSGGRRPALGAVFGITKR